jgi:hypothetical protein
MTDAATADALAGAGREPAFGLERMRTLHVGERWHRRAAGDYLAHAIAREPANLVAHVQRIVLWLEDRDAAEAYGALLDLFIGLGTRGLDLRARMLTAARSVVAPDAFQYLRDALRAGGDARDRHPPAPCSVLTRSLTGTLDAVTAAARDAAADYDGVALARDHLFAGNIEAAQAALERTLRAHPERADAAAELLAIFLHTRDSERLRTLKREFGDRLADPAAWDGTERALAAAPRH